MNDDPLARLLAGNLPDPDGGPPLSVPVVAVAVEDSLADSARERVAVLGLGARLALVSDPHTHAALGERVARTLSGVARIEHVALPAHPHADADTAIGLRTATAGADALIAVGSGTINDLCKYVAAQAGKPYVVFGTAPSMNGYTSVNAAITVHGHKQSLTARVPVAVFLDLGVLAAAPPRMIRAGLGDSLCRATAQTDWLLARLVRGDAYRAAPFALLAEDEAELFAASGALLHGDLAAMRRLARTLLLSGFGMTLCGGSMPASQGEHLLGHYAEMRADPAWPACFHGEQIGVTTLTMARLQAELLDGPPPRLSPAGDDETEVLAHFGPEVGRACWRELEAKQMDSAARERANARIAAGWDAFRAAVQALHPGADALQQVLARAGAPTQPHHLSWPVWFHRDAVRHARAIRNRYTFLDLAAQSGRLEAFASRQ